MGITKDFDGDEIIEDSQLATKHDVLANKVQKLYDIVGNSYDAIAQLEREYEDVPDEGVFHLLYSHFCNAIPFSVGQSEIDAYLQSFSNRCTELAERMDQSEEDIQRNLGYFIMPAVLMYKAYNEGDNNFVLDIRGYELLPETFTSFLQGTPGRPLEVTLKTDKELEGGFEKCVGCTIKVIGGTRHDKIGYETTMSSFYHEHTQALDATSQRSEYGCSFYLINPDGTSQRVG